ncbi:MAG: SRPBCC family protein, partial [Anaerolineae bacterium]|nr:SRPBCC family protein [Anaerolineae bacterium]
MARVEKSIVFNADTDTIDAVALDGSRVSEWYVGIDESIPDGTYPEVGGVVELTYKVAGLSLDLSLTVLELVRGDYILYEMDGMMTGTQRWNHVPEGGGTRTTVIVDYTMPGGGLGK